MSAPATPAGESFTRLRVYAPLPRGRPRLSPRSRSDRPAERKPRTIAAKGQGCDHEQFGVAAEPGTPAPTVQAAPMAAGPSTPAAPTAHIPYYQGSASASPMFSFEGKLIFLTGINNVDQWIQQTESMARATHCYAELTNKFNAFPSPGTVAYFICQARFATAWRIIHETVTGPVWAYMRVLGYSDVALGNGDGMLPPCPSDAFYFAKLAGQRMLIPGTPEQPREEKIRMAIEVRAAQPLLYPSEKHFKRGIKWLTDIVENCVRQGDEDVTAALNSAPAQASDTVAEPAGLAGNGTEVMPIELEATPGPSLDEPVIHSMLNSIPPSSISPFDEATATDEEAMLAETEGVPRGVKREHGDSGDEGVEDAQDGFEDAAAGEQESEVSIESDTL